MAPIKFEENIKDKLDNRELQPSPDAWARLSERLDDNPGKKRNYWWIGLAASFVGLFVIFSLYFLKDTDGGINTNTQQIVVDEESAPLNSPEQNSRQEGIETTAVSSQQEKTINETHTKVIVDDFEQTKTDDQVVVMTPEHVKTENFEEPRLVEEINKNEAAMAKTEEEKKIDEVVAAIHKLQNEKVGIADEEINSLLAAAQKELKAQRLYDTTTKTVDAELLLFEVENDLQQSFRDKVFEALKSSYNTVKTAVADRNN